jgi:hypothetical protein
MLLCCVCCGGPCIAGAFAAFVAINLELRTWYSHVAPGVVTSSIPGISSEDEVDEFHALVGRAKRTERKRQPPIQFCLSYDT